MFHVRTRRRALLRGAALTTAGVALGLGSSLTSPRAAHAGGMPRRILFCITPHGFVQSALRMTPTDSLATSAPSRILAPLAGHLERLLVLEGLSMNSAISDFWASRNPHIPAHLHLLTGAATAERDVDGSGGGPSVDQILAARIGASTPFASVEVGFSGSDMMNGLGLGAYNWAARSSALPYVAEPAALFDYLFSGLSGTTTPIGLDTLQGRLARFATDEHAALLTRFSGVSAARLEAHRDLLAALADRLGSAATLSCAPPSTPGPSSSYAQRYAAFGDVIASAFACDLVRVATLAFDDQDAVDCGGRAGEGLHFSYAHETTDRNGSGGDPMADEVMTQASVNHAGHVASVLDSLAAVREPDGSSLLDHTLVVWTSELAVGRHDGTRAYYGLPFVLAGSSEHFRMGRYVKLAEDVPVEIAGEMGRTTRYSVGPSHNHLLVSLCHAMGADEVTSVGMESISLPGGVTLDATGPLPEVAHD